MNCRFCATPVSATFVDLGMQPLANSYVERARADEPETFYPLHARACPRCFLVQLPECASPETIFSDYAYLSSVSKSWLEHYARLADKLTTKLALGPGDLVVEIASNDGGLLRCFIDRGIRCLGVEPAANVAKIARDKGVDTVSQFFGTRVAEELVASGKSPRLVIGNNVLAHVPDLNDFVRGLRTLVAPDGMISLEFPHLVQLIANNQYDTIYHEHYSYLSLMTVANVFAHHGLTVFDVEELPTHGGSLRVFACRTDGNTFGVDDRVARLIESERAAGLGEIATYTAFGRQVHDTKRSLLDLLVREKRAGKKIVGYGAPAKGNTLLNYCGIREDFLDFTVDRSPLKQGRLLPGTRIPIESPDAIRDARPDFVMILPWNLEREIVDQLAYIREWGGKFIVPIPQPRIV